MLLLLALLKSAQYLEYQLTLDQLPQCLRCRDARELEYLHVARESNYSTSSSF